MSQSVEKRQKAHREVLVMEDRVSEWKGLDVDSNSAPD